MRKIIVGLLAGFFLLTPVCVRANDSLRAGQAFVNLSLTNQYFDSLPDKRVRKILSFLRQELASLKPEFIRTNRSLYKASQACYYLNRSRLLERGSHLSDRSSLLQLKDTLDMAFAFYREVPEPQYRENDYEEFINYNKAVRFIGYDVWSAASRYSDHASSMLYSDFRRIFLRARQEHSYQFDSLLALARPYGMSMQFRILDSVRHPDVPSSLNGRYWLKAPLELMVRFLQLKYIVDRPGRIDTGQLYAAFKQFQNDLKPQDSIHFGNTETITKDAFIRSNLGEDVIQELLHEIRLRYPWTDSMNIKDVDGDGLANIAPEPLYFPSKAPYPSDFKTVRNYQVSLQRMGRLDGHVRQILDHAGYADRCRYYYVRTGGFALATNLEQIDRDGKPLEDKRWSIRNEEKFTLYESIRSIFFANDGHFRVLAIVLSPQGNIPIADQKNNSTDPFGKGYQMLPADLENKAYTKMTLTILLYHFYQSDIGEVPVLDTSKRLTVGDHLRQTRLSALLNP
jgi:hypothetical protein